MNQRAQTNSVFKLAIFAIVAIAVLFLVLNFFPSQSTDTIKELRQLLVYAKGNEGKSVSKEIQIEKDMFFDAAKIFDDDTTSVSFACSSIECSTGGLHIEERQFYSEKKTSTTASARCFLSGNLYGCRIYFGLKPAQVGVKEIALGEEIDLAVEDAFVTIKVENSGELTATNVFTTAKIFKKTVVEGKETENLYAPEITDFAAEIIPGNSVTISFNLPIEDDGDFRLEVTAFGDEAGQDTKSFDFSVSNAQSVSECTPTTQDEPFFSSQENACLTKFNCEKCDLAFECRQAWEQTGETGLESASKGFALKTTPLQNGQC